MLLDKSVYFSGTEETPPWLGAVRTFLEFTVSRLV